MFGHKKGRTAQGGPALNAVNEKEVTLGLPMRFQGLGRA